MKRSDFFDLRLGKIPPQNTDAEVAVLGAIILESKVIHEIAGTLKPEFFYKEQHALIYEAVIQLYRESSPIDIITVTSQLRKMEKLDLVGGAYYITELTTKVNSSAHIFAHASLIIDSWVKREAIRISSETLQAAYEDGEESVGLLENSTAKMMETIEQVTRGKSDNFTDLIGKSLKMTVDRKDGDKELIGISTGFKGLNKVTGGLCAPDLTIIAGRPSMGKTAFAMQIALQVACKDNPVAIFSLEMSAMQLTQRLQSNHCDISLTKIRHGDVEHWEMERLVHKSNELSNKPIYIDDTAGISILELRSKAFSMKHKHKIKLIVIDYLQLMHNDSKSREEGVGNISKGLKRLAKDLDIPVIALSQLSRATETRGGDKRPMLSDLRESGSLEQDADNVMFLYRPEYYGIKQDADGNDVRGIAEIILAKHRNGALDSIFMRFLGSLVKFVELESVTNSAQLSIDMPTTTVSQDVPPF